MLKLIPMTLLLTTLAVPAASAQALISNGSQTGVVQAPTASAPVSQGPAAFGDSTAQQSTPIPPQMPTTTNPPGAAPAIAAPVAGASPGIPVLNAPSAQASPSPSP